MRLVGEGSIHTYIHVVRPKKSVISDTHSSLDEEQNYVLLHYYCSTIYPASFSFAKHYTLIRSITHFVFTPFVFPPACRLTLSSTPGEPVLKKACLSSSSKSRFKTDISRIVDDFVDNISDVCAEWSTRLAGSTMTSAVEHEKINLLRSNHKLKALVIELGGTCGRKNSGAGEDAIVRNFRALWALLSSSEVVASNEGWQFRRVLLGALCGPDTTFSDVQKFVGGTLSYGAFNEAQERRASTTTAATLHEL